MNPTKRMKEIEARVKSATPGTLHVEYGEGDDKDTPYYILSDNENFKTVETDSGYYGPLKGDAELFANARADITWLLERVKVLESALKKSQEDINWMLNNEKFLNPEVFDYIEAALKSRDGE